MQSVESGERALTRRSFLAVSAGALALLGTTACDNANNPYNLDGTANENAKPQDQAESKADDTAQGGSDADDTDAADVDEPAAAASTDYNLVEPGVLTILLDPSATPLAFYDSDSEKFLGYEVDLIAAIAQKLGLDPTVDDHRNYKDGIIDGITDGEGDIAIGGFVIGSYNTVDFSDTVLSANQTLVIRQDEEADSMAAVNAGAGAMEVGTAIAEEWATRSMPDVSVSQIDGGDLTALYDVENYAGMGTFDATVVSQAAACFVITHSDSGLEIATDGLITTDQSYGFAISKESPSLTKAINKALAELKADGTADQYQTKWFDKVIGY